MRGRKPNTRPGVWVMIALLAVMWLMAWVLFANGVVADLSEIF